MSINVICPWQDTIAIGTPWGAVIRAGVGQKRHPRGSAEGGQFAGEQVSLGAGIPDSIAPAKEAFKDHNRKRVKFAKAKKRAQEKYGDAMSGWPDDVRTEVKNMALVAFYAKKNFKREQDSALEKGIRINALGQWTNSEPDKRLAKRAAEVRREIAKAKADSRDSGETMRRAVQESKRAGEALHDAGLALIGVSAKAREMGEGRDSSKWSPELQAEYSDANKKMDDARHVALKAKAEVDRLERESTESYNDRIAGLIGVSDPIDIDLVEGTDFAMLGDLDGPMAGAARLISNRVYPREGTAKVTVHATNEPRAFISKNGSLWLSTTEKKDQTRTVAHEMGHWLSFNNQAVRYKANQFLKMRAGDEKPSPIYRQVPGLEEAEPEIGYKDKFKNPYAGKLYGDVETAFQMNETEIISMGFEYMATNPVQFAEDDPEYFDFIYTISRGG